MPTQFPYSRKIVCLIFSLSLSVLPCFGEYSIHGNIKISKEWSPKIYLSAINSFNDLNAVSEDFILNMAEIDKDGNFILTGQNIPNDDRLYRLHVCKKGDPIATIMIGGKEQNHCHLALKNNENLVFLGEDFLFQRFKISGNNSNNLLKKLQEQRIFWKKKQPINSKTSREYNATQLEKYLRQFADTTQSSLMGLMALHYLDYEQEMNAYSDFYLNLNEKWSETNAVSPYFTTFQNNIAFE